MAMEWTAEQQKVIGLRGKNILVSAAAGSGKTAVLVERILQRITEGENPPDVDQLLVVTFTRAAAAQMKERLMAALERRLLEEPDNVHLQKQTTLIHHAQITTIDGFCSYVVRNYFHQIDLDPAFRVADEGEQRLMEQDVLGEVLEASYESRDEDFLYYVSCFDDGRSDRRLEDITLKLYRIAQSQPWPGEWLQECLLPYRVQTEEELRQAPWIEQILRLSRAFLQEARELNRRALLVAASPGGPSQYGEALERDREFLEQLALAEDYETWRRMFLGWKPAALSRKKNPDMLEEKKNLVQELRKQMKKLVQEKIGDAFFSAELTDILSDMQHCERCVRAMTALTLRFAGRLSQVKREKNVLDFSDIEHLALAALVDKTPEGERRTAAAKELSARFAEIMIDEYQDSNLVQEKILTAVSRMEDGEHNIFMVGDVKQSIYKFRLARPELFMEKYDGYPVEEDAGHQEVDQTDENDERKSLNIRVDLHRNFRSRKEIVDSVNYLFRRIMTRSLGNIAYDDAAALRAGAVWPGEDRDTYMTELLLVSREGEVAGEAGNPQELEAHRIADRIGRMAGRETIIDRRTGESRPVRYQDIVILLRTVRGWSETFVRVLKQKGIPAYAVTRTGYFSAPEVVLTLNYLRLLDNFRQELPLAAVLTSPVGGLSAEELAKIKTVLPKEDGSGPARQGFRPLYSCLKEYLSRDETDELSVKLRRFMHTYRCIRDKISYTPVHKILTMIYEKTGYLAYASAMPAGEQREANLLMLVEKALAYEKTSYSGLFHFVRYIDSLQKYEVDFGEVSLAGELADQVQIMSIHNSKGLEFPVVFAAGMGKSFNVMDTREMAAIHPDMGIGIPRIDPVLRAKQNTLYRTVMQYQMQEEILGEELRILYVALTRAEQKLILTGTIDRVEKRIAAAGAAAGREDTALGYAVLYQARSCLDWILPALAEHPAFAGLAEDLYGRAAEKEAEKPRPRSGHGEAEPELRLELFTAEDLIHEEIRQQTMRQDARLQWEKLDSEETYDASYRELLERRLGWCYPWADEAQIPAKVSVSELKEQRFEEEQGHQLYEEPEIIPYVPVFMQGSRQTESGGARRGTAYHRVMECLDYAAWQQGVSCERQIRRLVEQNKLSAEDAAMLRAADFERFLQSPLGQRMAAAAREGVLKREQSFFLSVPAGEADSSWADSGETVLIQGVIDAYFPAEQGLVLVDYKTDRAESRDGRDLAEKYRVQLRYYGEALERLTGRKICEKWLYSFSLGKALEVPFQAAGERGPFADGERCVCENTPAAENK